MGLWYYDETEKFVRYHLNGIILRMMRGNRGPVLSNINVGECFEGTEHSVFQEDGSEDCNELREVEVDHDTNRRRDRSMGLLGMEEEFRVIGQMAVYGLAL